MIVNPTENHTRRVLRTEMKKSKKLTQRRTDPKPMKKKRMKKVSEQSNSDNPLPIKEEDDLITNCSLLHSPSLSQPMFDSIIDHNQFWHPNQMITPTDYYLPVNSSPYNHHLSPSDMDNSNSSIPENPSKNLNNGQSRKDKSLGLLCQR